MYRQQEQQQPVHRQPRKASTIGVDYIPQYDPGMTEMMAGVLQQSQQRTDAGREIMMEQDARFGELLAQTPDPEDMKKLIQNYEEGIHGILEDYGGDPGPARGEIMKRIGKEFTRPDYGYHRQAQEAAQLERQQKAQMGADYIPVQSIYDTIEDPETGEDISRIEYARRTGDTSALQTRGIQAPKYTESAFKLGQTIKDTFESEGIQISPSGIKGLLREYAEKGIAPERLKDIIDQWVPAFIEMNPGIEHDNRRDRVPWLRDWETGELDEEGIKRFIAGTLAGVPHTDRRSRVFGDPAYQGGTPQEYKPSPSRPGITRDATYNKDAQASIEEHESMKESIKERGGLEHRLEVLNELMDIPAFQEILSKYEEEPSIWDDSDIERTEREEDAQRNWEQGEAGIADAINLVGGKVGRGLYGAVRGIAKGVKVIGDFVFKGTDHYKEIQDLLTKEARAEYREDINFTEEDRIKRGMLLMFIAEDDSFSEHLKVGEDGVLEVDYQKGGLKAWTQLGEKALFSKAARSIHSTFKKGEEGMKEDIKNIEDKQKEYLEKHETTIMTRWNQLRKDRPDLKADEALDIAIDNMITTQEHRQLQYVRAFPSSDLSLEKSVSTKLKNNIAFSESKVPYIDRSKRKSERDDIRDIIRENDITSMRIVPVDGELELLVNEDNVLNKYILDLKEGGGILPQSLVDKVIQVQDFITAGLNFEDAEVNLAGVTYRFNSSFVGLDENNEEGIYDAGMRIVLEDGTEQAMVEYEGIPISAEKLFEQEYVDFIYRSLDY